MSHFATEPIGAPGAVGRMSHCATLIELPNGDLLTAWFSGAFETAPDQCIVVARRPVGSSDWTQPMPVVDTPGQADGQPVFLLDHGGVLWLYYVTLAGQDWTTARMMRRCSRDLGHRWEAAEALPMEEGFMFRSRPLDSSCLGQAGRWIFPIYDEKTWRSLMLISDDDGATWRAGQFISTPVGNIHPCVVPLADGHLLAFLRTGGKGGYIWQTTSADGGESWATPVPTMLPNPNSGLDLLRLESGALVLAFNNSSQCRTPLCVALSDDEGFTWSHMQVLEDAEGEFSYPTLIQSRCGHIHGVYTWQRQWIQHVEFDEDWLRRGPARPRAGCLQ
ncbi:MAG TPA: hypothetical protein EYH31_13620 [Anaerolineae bacterium]|nr:hypothetical protein [Anaerolineae bacterium]